MTALVADVSSKEFDYIVIGGGTAGLVLAARLSEDTSVSVLVLEAGEANLDDNFVLFPVQQMQQRGNPKYDWMFKTVKQKYSNDREYSWPRGKSLGGSSAMNFFLWNKPAREYLDALGQLGNPGWSWDQFDKYSKKSEKFAKPDHDLDLLTFDPAHRGMDGPLGTSFPNVISNIERPYIESLKKNGIEVLVDSSSGITSGTTPITSTIDPVSHMRTYAGNAYYTPNASRQNLTVLVKAYVSSIITLVNADGTVTATGVKFAHEGQSYKVKSAKEVCLAAGAIMSPQILELSGIGKRSILEKAGIDVKVELPGVGENVQEHLYGGVAYELKEDAKIEGYEITTYDSLLDPQEAMKHFGLFASGKGIFNLGTINLTFVPLDTVSADTAKIQKTLTETIRSKSWPTGLKKQYELQLEHIEKKVPSLEIMLGAGLLCPGAIPSDPTKRHASICFGLNSPFSRGTIHIESSDALAHPVIDPHLFEQPYDLLTLVELVKFNRKLAQTEPLKSLLKETEVYPGPEVSTDEEIADWVKNVVNTTFHTVGSCSMLPLEDGGVVDPKLKVYKTTNIRVVDLSIVPLHVGSHTQALAYALGEQAADIIKGKI